MNYAYFVVFLKEMRNVQSENASMTALVLKVGMAPRFPVELIFLQLALVR